MTCCGKERKSAFCPECGKKLRTDGGLPGLLAGCREMERRTAEEAEAYQRGGDRGPGEGDYFAWLGGSFKTLAVRRRAEAGNWKAWGDALEALLYPDGGEGA